MSLSTFKTRTFSVPIPKISFSLIDSSPLSIIPPLIEKYVTIPVADVVPTAFARLKKLVETPILKELLFKLIEVLNPDKETKSVFVNP